ncbi:MAG: cobalamin-binding protein [Deltaproteobacteria bacterium]|nr:cobalamin-binding protein [Deltaproteobacteria bacterium]MBM4340948.1 cobalamin-binding protein [Deltaproteobacteria bacterium]
MFQEEIQRYYEALREPKINKIEELVREFIEKHVSSVVILNEGLIGAMGIIGQEFKASKLWVPEVLLAARNMHRGIEILKPELLKNNVPSKGKFLIGTVKGDIHDIGKNLVIMMMTGAGYQVIDLGIDVPQERFLEAIDKERPDIVGLSALLTTTMLEMKEVVKSIPKNFSSPPKIIIGGAPVTRKFSEEIAADGYGEDAIRAVELADQLLMSKGMI